MKKILLLAAAVAAVACAKEAPQTSVENQVVVTTPAEENETSMPVAFGTNLTASVTVKSQGGVDAWDATQTLYVYGFQRQAVAIDYATVTPFIDKVSAVSPKTGVEGDLDLINPANKLPFYYQDNNTYDFFGYYIDDLTPATVKETDGIYVPVTITGGEDIMVAKANPAVDGASLSDYRYAYSAYAARRGVKPTLNFQHQLVQFTFNIESGSETAADHSLKVSKLELNALAKGDLYVAGNFLGFKNVTTELTTLSLFGFNGYDVPNKVDGAAAQRIGDCIMVIPNTNAPVNGDTFKGTLYLTQKDAEEMPVDFTLDFKDVEGAPAELTSFAAGYSFDITLKVYNMQKIDVSAKLADWKSGGKISIDTDKLPEVL